MCHVGHTFLIDGGRMRENNRASPQGPSAISNCVLEYLDWRRLLRIRDYRKPERRLRLLVGHTFRCRYEFDYYTKDLEGKFVAFGGMADRMPFIAVGLSSRLAYPERHVRYPVVHG